MPLRPHPSQVPPASQVGEGVQTCIWAAGQETRRGHWSAISRRSEAFRRTDDEGPYAAGGAAAEYTDMDGEEAKMKKG